MTSTEALAVIVSGALIPFLVHFVQKSTWSSDRKRILVLALSIVFGSLTAILAGTIGIPEPARQILEKAVIYAGAIVVASQGVWTLVRGKLDPSEEELDDEDLIAA